MSHRPQHARRGRHVAGRGAALLGAGVVAAGVAVALWPAGGNGAILAPQALFQARSAAAASSTAPSSSAPSSTAQPQAVGATPSAHAPVKQSTGLARPAPKRAVRSQHRPVHRTRTAVDRQLVTVTAPQRRSTVAVVRRWVHRGGKWVRVGARMHAHLGVGGLTRHPSETRPATPVGSFSLTQAFGAAPNTGHRVTDLRYIHIHWGDTWGSRPWRRTYNRYYNCHCPHATLYALRHSLFRYGMVIDYNRAPVVPGAGSGFFVHVTDGHPTGGCVALPARNVRTLLGWLRPDLHPHIRIHTARR